MKLADVQKLLKVPKTRLNSFANYKYRNAEDILEAFKSIADGAATVTLSDEMVEVGGRVYVKATAKFKGADEFTVAAYAREPEDKKGSDASQITGAASSYARKYALNGLFAIDDTQDPDATNTHGKAADIPVSSEEDLDL